MEDEKESQKSIKKISLYLQIQIVFDVIYICRSFYFSFTFESKSTLPRILLLLLYNSMHYTLEQPFASWNVYCKYCLHVGTYENDPIYSTQQFFCEFYVYSHYLIKVKNHVFIRNSFFCLIHIIW